MTAARSPERLRAGLVRALPLLRALAFVAAVGIVVAMAVRSAREVDLGEIAWWPLAPALAAAVVWWLLLARGWALLVSGRSGRAEIATWCRTQPLRYLPGGIWAPASRAVIVRGSWLDKLATVAAENAFALCAAAALGGLALAAAGEPIWAPLVLALAVPPVAARFLRSRTRVTPARALVSTGNYLVAFLGYVAAAVATQAAVSGLEEPLAVAGAAAIAWSVGLVVVIAPGGLAVREVAYVAILAGTLPEAELTAAAVLLRLVTIVAELGVLLALGRPSVRLQPSGAG